MLFGLGIDGVVLLYVAQRLAVADDASADVQAAISGPSSSMLLGMWTTAATFYGLMFVDFPTLQQLGRLLGHSMVICGLLTLVMVPALLPRRPPRRAAALRMPRLAVDRPLAPRDSRRRGGRDGRVGLQRPASASTQRSSVCGRLTPAARLETRDRTGLGLPNDVYVVLAEGPALEPLLETNERLARRLSTELPTLAFQPPSRLLPPSATQALTIQEIRNTRLSPDTVRASLERARVASDFTPGAFDPFAERLSRLFDPSERLTYDGYVTHGLGDLLDRFIVRDADRWTLATYVFPSSAEQTARVQAIVAAVDPAQAFTGLTLVNRELARSSSPVHQGSRDRHGDRHRARRGCVQRLAPVTVCAGPDRHRADLGRLHWRSAASNSTCLPSSRSSPSWASAWTTVSTSAPISGAGDAERATAELAPVISVAAAITLLGYGTLVNSSYPPLRSIGVVSAVSVVALALVSVLVLPAMLVSERLR